MRLEIRNDGFVLTQDLRDAIERKLRFHLGRYCQRITRIVVRLTGLDQYIGNLKIHCRIAIRLVPYGHVSIDVAAVDLDTALEWASHRIGPAVSRESQRWRDRRGRVAL